jgi:hypothetical protein
VTNPYELRWLDTAPAWFREAFTVLWAQLSDLASTLATITSQQENIMAQVQVDQTDLDNLATNLENVKTALATEIQNLQQQLPQANLGGLNQALSDLQSLEPPAPTPAPAPAPTPDQPPAPAPTPDQPTPDQPPAGT